MDRRAWLATVHRDAKSWTQLKQLSMPALIDIWLVSNLLLLLTDTMNKLEYMSLCICAYISIGEVSRNRIVALKIWVYICIYFFNR